MSDKSNNPITWQSLMDQMGIHDLKIKIPKADGSDKDDPRVSLLDALIIPSILNYKDETYDYSRFIQGRDLPLSLKVLEGYCLGAEVKRDEEVFFYGGAVNNDVSTIAECWKHVWDNIEYINPGKPGKEIKKSVGALIGKSDSECSVALPNGDSLCITTCLKSAALEDFFYQITAYSMLACIWPVWELVTSNDCESLCEEYCLDKDTLCKQLKIIYEVLIPHKIKLNDFLTSLTPVCEQRDFFNRFIVPTLKGHKIPFADSDSSIHRLVMGKPSQKNVCNFLETITAPEFSHAKFSEKLLSYQQYKYLKIVRDLWSSYLTEHQQSKASLSSLISNYYDKFEKERWVIRFSSAKGYIDLIEALRSIKEAPADWAEEDGDFFTYQLSVFFIIALTWLLWDEHTDVNSSPTQKTCSSAAKQQERIRNLLFTLSDLLFPKTSDERIIGVAQEEYPHDTAEKLYDDAAALFDYYQDYKAAVEKLEELIVNYSTLASNDTLGKTYSLLIKCHEMNADIIPAWLGSLKDLQDEAERYGAGFSRSSVPKITTGSKRAVASETGLYYVKCSNKSIVDWIYSTVPSNWRLLTEELNHPTTMCTGGISSQTEPEFIYPDVLSNNIRFVFADDNYEQNLNDALSTLEKFRLYVAQGNADSSTWGKIEIVIRCEQEKVSPLLDTACSFLGETYDDKTCVFQNNPIRIHLLDEKKRAADLLYARYPLFYPLTVSQNQENTEARKFNLVILSTNPDITHATWLIRQAFWLIPHNRVSVDSTITVLSPQYKELALTVTSLCPGLAAFITCDNETPDSDPVKIDDIRFPKIEFKNVNVSSSRTLENFVENEIRNDSLLYYIIDASSDLESINLGIKIREISIKKTLKRKQLRGYIPGEHVIAVRCDNPDYANLAKQLIVPKEAEHDNRWFNDYKLIAYGSVQELFSWDELVGGQIEFMSECMHLQYCTASGEDYDYTSDAPAEYLWSYYRRFYNRDSSYSAAMSMPYRLFEAGVLLRPSEWIITDRDAYWSEANRNILAERFESGHDCDSLMKWEHSRFCCYLLSTGWLPASPQQVRYYMNNGVSRHTLQIAKLHPCLCSWDALIELYKVLHQAYLGSEDDFGNRRYNIKFAKFASDNFDYFQGLDFDNICQTADMLRAKPLPFKRKKKEPSSTR